MDEESLAGREIAGTPKTIFFTSSWRVDLATDLVATDLGTPTMRPRTTPELPIVQEPRSLSGVGGRILGYPVQEGRVAP